MDAKQVLEMVRNRTWLFDKEVMAVIEQALECQAPKKLQGWNNEMLAMWSTLDGIGYNYCPFCGQKIDWG